MTETTGNNAIALQYPDFSVFIQPEYGKEIKCSDSHVSVGSSMSFTCDADVLRLFVGGYCSGTYKVFFPAVITNDGPVFFSFSCPVHFPSHEKG